MAKTANERELKRFNLRMGQELFDMYQDQAERIGVPVSAYMIMVLNENMKQIQAVQQIQNFAPYQDVISTGIKRAMAMEKTSVAVLDGEKSDMVG